MATSGARRAVLWSALLYTPPFLAALGGFLFLLLDGLASGGGLPVPLLVLLAVLAVLLGHQSVQALRDLGSAPRSVTGQVIRKWKRSEALLWGSHYIRVSGVDHGGGMGDRIFTLDVVDWMGVEEGDQVAVRHYPHTGSVESIEKVPAVGEPRTAP